ncbi:ABC transporter permease, partial [Methylophaga sp. UBA5088]
MNTSVQVISNFQLALAFIPVIVVLLMMVRWSLKAGFAVYALIRMLIQLLLVGYVLTTVFAAEQSWIVMLVMLVMVST